MTHVLSRGLAAAFTLAFAAAMPALAQPAASKGTDPNTGGQPSSTGVDQTNKTPAVIERAQNSRPAQATKRVAKKGADATKRAGKKTAGVVRNTGDRIADKLPKGGTASTGGGEAGTNGAPATSR